MTNVANQAMRHVPLVMRHVPLVVHVPLVRHVPLVMRHVPPALAMMRHEQAASELSGMLLLRGAQSGRWDACHWCVE